MKNHIPSAGVAQPARELIAADGGAGLVLQDQTSAGPDRRTVCEGAIVSNLNRRAVLSTAWTVPVIAIAVAAPLTAASTASAAPVGRVCMDPAGSFDVRGRALMIFYRSVPDIYEVNARGAGWSKSYGTNYGTAPSPGSTTWRIELPDVPTWIQVHSFNTHYGESTCPV